MSFKSLLLVPAIFGLAGCLENNTQRGVAGAAGGAIISGVTRAAAQSQALLSGGRQAICAKT